MSRCPFASVLQPVRGYPCPSLAHSAASTCTRVISLGCVSCCLLLLSAPAVCSCCPLLLLTTPAAAVTMNTHTGLDDRSITGPALLEADQGDTISGKVSRAEAAATVVAALRRPDAAFKTFELRRSEAADAQGKEMSEAAFTRLFLKLALGELWATGAV